MLNLNLQIQNFRHINANMFSQCEYVENAVDAHSYSEVVTCLDNYMEVHRYYPIQNSLHMRIMEHTLYLAILSPVSEVFSTTTADNIFIC